MIRLQIPAIKPKSKGAVLWRQPKKVPAALLQESQYLCGVRLAALREPTRHPLHLPRIAQELVRLRALELQQNQPIGHGL